MCPCVKEDVVPGALRRRHIQHSGSRSTEGAQDANLRNSAAVLPVRLSPWPFPSKLWGPGTADVPLFTRPRELVAEGTSRSPRQVNPMKAGSHALRPTGEVSQMLLMGGGTKTSTDILDPGSKAKRAGLNGSEHGERKLVAR